VYGIEHILTMQALRCLTRSLRVAPTSAGRLWGLRTFAASAGHDDGHGHGHGRETHGLEKTPEEVAKLEADGFVQNWSPSSLEWYDRGFRKMTSNPLPPVADSLGIYVEDPNFQVPEANPDLPFVLDRSEGVTVLMHKTGPYAGQEVVLAHGVVTLEWAIPSPPPIHTFDEPPIIKVHPELEDA